MSHRNSPNQERLKEYYQKKGQQQNQYNELMNDSFKKQQIGGAQPANSPKVFHLPGQNNNRNMQ